jgi:pimeloyl-ACP methyl ester carboxylesterase
VILVDPTFLSPERQREVYESDVVAQHRQFLGSDRSDLLARARERHVDRSSEIIELITDARLRTHTGAFDVLVPPNPDYRELVRGIRVPMLLVIASKGVVSVDAARELQALNPSLRHELVADAGHGIPYDQPERLAAVVGSFLRPLAAA